MKSEFEKEMFEYSKLRRAEDMFQIKLFGAIFFARYQEKKTENNISKDLFPTKAF